jgi:1,4-alpha-glucan branching enzyme
MLYLDYSRKPGEWLPNAEGGNENRDAIAFLKRSNELIYGLFPGAMTIAEESTAFAGVSTPTNLGGLGFGFKWNMGWMHDTLEYMSCAPIRRRWSHDKMTFGLLYAFAESRCVDRQIADLPMHLTHRSLIDAHIIWNM